MSAEHWQTYYRSGAIATCPTTADGAYDQELKTVWSDFFGSLDDGARILDVGTGNGAVPMIAKESADLQGKQFDIHGTDLANIDPLRFVVRGATSLAGVVFHPGISTTDLPFESHSFDAVTGHYALEYMPLQASLAEISRVLKPGAAARFVLHHSESLIVKNAQSSLTQGRLVLEKINIFLLLRELINAQRLRPGATQALLTKYSQGLEKIQKAAEKSPASSSILTGLLYALENLRQRSERMLARQCMREIDYMETELRDAMLRFKDLTTCALSESSLKNLLALADANQLRHLESGPMFHNATNLVGWSVVLQKADSN